tara:strand:+ start:18473 stop:19165 length:693 start_codon:yes stop_codon:yes gene_type:complete
MNALLTSKQLKTELEAEMCRMFRTNLAAKIAETQKVWAQTFPESDPLNVKVGGDSSVLGQTEITIDLPRGFLTLAGDGDDDVPEVPDALQLVWPLTTFHLKQVTFNIQKDAVSTISDPETQNRLLLEVALQFDSPLYHDLVRVGFEKLEQGDIKTQQIALNWDMGISKEDYIEVFHTIFALMILTNESSWTFDLHVENSAGIIEKPHCIHTSDQPAKRPQFSAVFTHTSS